MFLNKKTLFEDKPPVSTAPSCFFLSSKISIYIAVEFLLTLLIIICPDDKTHIMYKTELKLKATEKHAQKHKNGIFVKSTLKFVPTCNNLKLCTLYSYQVSPTSHSNKSTSSPNTQKAQYE